MGEKARKHESREFLATRRKAIMEKAAQRRNVSSPKQRGEAALPPLRAPSPPPPGNA